MVTLRFNSTGSLSPTIQLFGCLVHKTRYSSNLLSCGTAIRRQLTFNNNNEALLQPQTNYYYNPH